MGRIPQINLLRRRIVIVRFEPPAANSVILACLHSRKRVAGTERLRVAASLFGSHAVRRCLRKQPDRSTDLLLACGVLNSVGTAPGRVRFKVFRAPPATSHHSRESDSGSANLRIGVGERSEPLPLLRIRLSTALTVARVIAIGGPAGTKFGGNGELSACFRARLRFRGESMNSVGWSSGTGAIQSFAKLHREVHN